MNKKKYTLRQYCLGSIFAAMIFAATAFLKIPMISGYVHLGDTLIFLAAVLLPTPIAVVTAAIGGSMADLLGGYAIWMPATIVIKALTAVGFTRYPQKLLCLRNYIALLAAAVFCAGGYYLFEAVFIAGNFYAPLAYVLPNLLQTGVSAVLFIALAAIFDNVPQLKSMIDNR